MRAKRNVAVARWLCRNNTKNMFVRIIHPGGHVELQDGPIIAAEIMRRNPKFCVAYPNVFKQPWAIVAPETTLMPGHKFYVVPISTVRKLQLLSMKYSAPRLLQNETTTPNGTNEGESHRKHSGCFLFMSGDHPNEVPYSCLKNSDNGGIGTTLKERKADNCCTFLITGMTMKASRKDKSKETEAESPKSFGSSETDALAIVRTTDQASSPRRLSSFDHWQPSLESIAEEF